MNATESWKKHDLHPHSSDLQFEFNIRSENINQAKITKQTAETQYFTQSVKRNSRSVDNRVQFENQSSCGDQSDEFFRNEECRTFVDDERERRGREKAIVG